jgi:phosphoglycolate phosphatase-like HAD superfamily hydrolase
MLLQAARELNLDLSASWLIGDSTTDLETARNAGVKSVLVRTGHAGRDGKFAGRPDQTAENVLDAVNQILARTHV